MRFLSLFFLFLVVLVSAVLPGQITTAEDTQADVDSAAVPSKIPEDAKQTRNPRPASPESLEHGQLIYGSQCTRCHGTSGDGKGRLVERLKLQIPDFREPAVQKARTDGELFYILSFGHGKMSGQGSRLDEETRWDLVNYVRFLGKLE
jgi:mono/diheme cytochrome c family protein